MHEPTPPVHNSVIGMPNLHHHLQQIRAGVRAGVRVGVGFRVRVGVRVISF